MKVANLVLKIAALILGAAAIVCCILGNLETITDGLVCVRDRIKSKGVRCCSGDAEVDFEDWDI